MLIDFKSDLYALEANMEDFIMCREILSKLASWNVTESSEDRETVADLFYTVLRAIQLMEDEKSIQQIQNEVMDAFDNINQISKTGKSNSSLVLMDFLSDLYQKRKNPSVRINLSDEDTVVLLNDLEPIKFIFLLIDEEGNRFFPANRLLSNIVLDADFINTRVEPYHINLLQLAVEMYRIAGEGDTKEKFNQLIEKCNLRFIKYLNGACPRVDTLDMCNYKYNQVMIFYDANKQKVLIRHEDEKYFYNLPDGVVVQHEVNSRMIPIGHFVEMDVEGVPLDFSEAIKENPKEFLRLIYEKGCKNILIEKMILRTSNGSYEALNPFCRNDRRIIKGKLNGREGKVCLPEDIIDIIHEGRMQLFSMEEGHGGINQISLGLCMTLLEKERVDIDNLFAETADDEWGQNIVIQNWVRNTKDAINSIEFIVRKYVDDLDYCSKENLIRNHIFEQERMYDVLPFSISLRWIYDILKLPEKPSVFLGTISYEEDEDEYYIDFSPKANKSLAKLEHREISHIMSNNVILSEETDKDNFYQEGENRYFTLKDGAWYSSSELQNIYKLLVIIELLNSRLVPYEMCDCFHENAYQEFASIMDLYKKELSDIKVKKVDTRSLYKIRLIHNILLNKINKDNWSAYFEIFKKQQIISFSDIIKDPLFSKNEIGTLVVPKDRVEEDAVLRKVYENYIRIDAERDGDWWYTANEITRCNGEVYIGGDRVTTIRFLFDNTEHGTATIRTLAANLGKEKEWVKFEKNRTSKDEAFLKVEIENQSRKCPKYCCGTDVISTKDIYVSNRPNIEVHSFFGTREGDKLVEKFLMSCGINKSDFSVSHNKEITHKADIVKSECDELGIRFDKAIYVVVREFNMPKKSLLPKGAVGKAEFVATLLVKKSENY